MTSQMSPGGAITAGHRCEMMFRTGGRRVVGTEMAKWIAYCAGAYIWVDSLPKPVFEVVGTVKQA